MSNTRVEDLEDAFIIIKEENDKLQALVDILSAELELYSLHIETLSSENRKLKAAKTK